MAVQKRSATTNLSKQVCFISTPIVHQQSRSPHPAAPQHNRISPPFRSSRGLKTFSIKHNYAIEHKCATEITALEQIALSSFAEFISQSTRSGKKIITHTHKHTYVHANKGTHNMCVCVWKGDYVGHFLCLGTVFAEEVRLYGSVYSQNVAQIIRLAKNGFQNALRNTGTHRRRFYRSNKIYMYII